MTNTDEKILSKLGSDWSQKSGVLGAALYGLYGMAIGMRATRIVEVGTAFGGSTRALVLAAMRTGGKVISIDIEDRSANIPPEFKPWWTQMVGPSQTLAPKVNDWHPEPIDLLFIDGEHSFPAVANELRHLGGKVREGGLIVLDDCWHAYPGPEVKAKEQERFLNGHLGFPGVFRAFEEYGDCVNHYLWPYGTAAAIPGGERRTMGVILK